MIQTEQDVLREMRRRLRREPDPEIWVLMQREGRVSDVLRAMTDKERAETLDALEAQVRRDEGLARRGGRGAQIRPPTPPGIPADDRARALARIVALEAAQLPSVETFRRKALRGSLLEVEQVASWIERQAKRQGRPTRFVMVPLDEEGWPTARGKLWPPPEKPGVAYSSRTLDYPDSSGWTQTVKVKVGSPLDRLRSAARELANLYLWQEAQAAAFVLTDLPPAPALAQVEVVHHPKPAGQRIRLTVNPRVKPFEVAKVYTEARSGSLFGDARFGLQAGTPSRAMSGKHAELGVFANRVNDGRSWRDALAAWNSERSGHHYEDVRPFQRDAGKAYERITGEQLEWRGGRRQASRRGSKGAKPGRKPSRHRRT